MAIASDLGLPVCNLIILKDKETELVKMLKLL